MTPSETQGYIDYLFKEIGKRKSLGGYSPDADVLLNLCLIVFDLLKESQARNERKPRKKKEEE